MKRCLHVGGSRKVSNAMSDIATLTLDPDLCSVTQAQSWLEQTAIEQQWPPRTVFALQLSMDEALTNTLMHGFIDKIHDAVNITLKLSADDMFVTLEIIDNGIQFDPTLKSPDDLVPLLDQVMPGGHGLRLMRHYLHDIQYTFIDGYNHLQLIAAIDDP